VGPNVLIVLADDLGPDHIGAYGLDPGAPPTPALDALAARGMRFDRAYAHPSCSPTRTAVLTGLDPHRTGIGSPIGLDETTAVDPALPNLPRQLGYASTAVGKWHLHSSALGDPRHPNALGFDRYVGAMHNLGREIGDGTDEDYFRWLQTEDGETAPEEGYVTTAQVDDALDAMDHMAPPWFVYLALSAAHAPFHFPPDALHSQDVSAEGYPPRYDAMVESIDAELGRLFAGVPDDTIVVFLGDNGTASYAYPVTDPRFYLSKFTVAEPGIRIPLVVAGPGIPPGTSDALVHAVDLPATLLELAGRPPLDGDGVSFAGALSGGPGARTEVFSQRFSPNGPGPYDRAAAMVRDARYKLMVNERGERLFDLDGREVEGPDLLATGVLTEAQQAAYDRLRASLDPRFEAAR
jgi:arylsulfatase A-like enzyme